MKNKNTKLNKLSSAYSIAYFTQDELLAELRRRNVWVLSMSKADAEDYYREQEKITETDWDKMIEGFNDALTETNFREIMVEIIKTT